MRLVEGVGTGSGEDLLAVLGWCAVRKRKLEVLGEELLDVWAADVVGLLNLDDLEDLQGVLGFIRSVSGIGRLTWMFLKRER